MRRQNVWVLKRRKQNLDASRNILSIKVCLVIMVIIITDCIPLSEATRGRFDRCRL